MANHKRGRPKNRRSGCLMCKPHKANGVKKRKFFSGNAGVGSKLHWNVSGPWRQEANSQIKEIEQTQEHWYTKNEKAHSGCFELRHCSCDECRPEPVNNNVEHLAVTIGELIKKAS